MDRRCDGARELSWADWLGVSRGAATETLLDTLSSCHQNAAIVNNNASSAALMNAAVCNATFEHAVASALLTFGSKHGPTTAARDLLYVDTKEEIIERLEGGEILPGFGNAFYKKSIDPAFVPLDHLLRETYPQDNEKIDRVAKLIFKVKGRALYPNPAAYTAICSDLVGLMRGTEIMLVIACRLPAWSRQYVSVPS